MILKHLILIAHPDKDGHYEPSYVGYLLAFGMFAGQVVGAFGECQYFQTMMRVGMQTRSGKCTNEALHTSSAFRRPPDLVGVPCTPLARGSEATPSTLSQEVFFFFPCSFDYINMSRCSVTVFERKNADVSSDVTQQWCKQSSRSTEVIFVISSTLMQRPP